LVITPSSRAASMPPMCTIPQTGAAGRLAKRADLA